MQAMRPHLFSDQCLRRHRRRNSLDRASKAGRAGAGLTSRGRLADLVEPNSLEAPFHLQWAQPYHCYAAEGIARDPKKRRWVFTLSGLYAVEYR